jgi:hypothetical protein
MQPSAISHQPSAVSFQLGFVRGEPRVVFADRCWLSADS